jgi:transcriptional regulator with XRE-family HTH domain
MLDRVSESTVAATPKQPSAVDVHVGTRIRLRRNVLGVSQTTLAEKIGVTFQQVQKYEKGTNRVGASRIQAIATFLTVPVSYFFDEAPGASDDPAAENEMAKFISSPEGRSLNRTFASIKDPQARRQLAALVKTVAELGTPH